MAAKDLIHDAVKNTLVKDGWTITHDPYPIRYKGLTVSADLGAERTIAAERAGEKIVVEIKSFITPSLIQDFEEALGQYNLYFALLQKTQSEHVLYLALSEGAYRRIIKREALQAVIEMFQIKLLVVNTIEEEIVIWTS
ncbi:MAG: XisH protein [Chloroflexi bacterium]|nr:XisH protein [Ardenticatenaceae bacterium]MBL1128039.1 XisH protein [Chloroflexota bacterium]NOG34111.1 XisH protein [Chloroflexota bacterium]GIK56890.1 MAG: hypothetical protein BroJett015_25530 [Chloroflexota bacterium]